MKREIKSIDGRVIFSGEYATDKDLIEAANLRGADLRGADLSGATLYGKNIVSIEYHCDIKHGDNYQYQCYAAITTQGEIFICMGCKKLTLGQWQANWNNNTNEFPVGSRESRQRRAVYDYLVTWAKIEVERLDTIYKRNPNGSFILEEKQS